MHASKITEHNTTKYSWQEWEKLSQLATKGNIVYLSTGKAKINKIFTHTKLHLLPAKRR